MSEEDLTFWKKLRDVANATLQDTATAVLEFQKMAQTAFHAVGKAIGSITTPFQAVSAQAQGLFSSLKKGAKDLVAPIAQAFNRVEDAISKAFEPEREIFKKIVQKFKDIKDQAGKVCAPIKTVGSALMELGSMGAKFASGFASTVRGAFSAVSAASQNVWEAIKESFRFESLTTQFEILFGSLDKAKSHMQMIKKIADQSPFSDTEIAAASKSLQTMGSELLNTQSMLELCGDVAVATGEAVGQVAQAVSNTYDALRSGKPIAEAASELENMGAILPATTALLQEMEQAGSSKAEMWEVVTTSLERFSGSMATVQKTGDGMIGTLETNWMNGVRQFGDAFSDIAKDSLGTLSKQLALLEKNGAIKSWAEAAVKALEPVKNLIIACFGNETRGEALTAAWDYLKSVFTYGANLLMAAAEYVGKEVAIAVQSIFNRESTTQEKREKNRNKFNKSKDEAGENHSVNTKELLAKMANLAEKAKAKTQDDIGKADPPEAEEAKAAREAAEKAAVKAELEKAEAAENERVKLELEKQEALKKEREDAEKEQEAQKQAHEANLRTAQANLENAKEQLDLEEKIAKEKRNEYEKALGKYKKAWQAYTDPKSVQKEEKEKKKQEQEEERADKKFKVLEERIPDIRDPKFDRENRKKKAPSVKEQFDAIKEGKTANMTQRLKDWRTERRLTNREQNIRDLGLAKEARDGAKDYLKDIEGKVSQIADTITTFTQDLKALQQLK